LTQAVTIFTDGGSRGNPGPAAAAYVLYDENKKEIYAKADFLGNATNNIAEYTAFLNALKKARQINCKTITAYSDSELMVKQIQGQYKVKNAQIKVIYSQCKKLLQNFDNWELTHVKRNKNARADELVNSSLDKKENLEYAAEIKQKPKKQKSQIKKTLKLAILLSGSGTTMANILQYIKAGALNAKIELVISSRSTVAGLQKAKQAGLKTVIIRKKDYPDIEQFSNQIVKELTNAKVDLVVQAGWLCLWKIPPEFKDRVMNIHPALLPSFGGKGMWGHHVHKAVLEAGCKVSGCTVHFCTNEYDKGKIIVKKYCPVEPDDTPETLAARVFKQECIAYPQAIKLFAEGKLKPDKR